MKKRFNFIKSAALVFAAVFFIRSYIVQTNIVEGSSMNPTLNSGNYIVTDELSYRFSAPQRGEIIIFKNRQDIYQSYGGNFVKRIIGMPGEKAMVKKGQVYINDKLLDEPYLLKGTITIPGHVMREGKTIIIPQGQYAVMGDNREFSSDSREWGPISRNDIVGEVTLVYWPPQSAGVVSSD